MHTHFSHLWMPKCNGHYDPAAQLVATRRRARQVKRIKHRVLRKYVVEHFENRLTPEQIDNWKITCLQLTNAQTFHALEKQSLAATHSSPDPFCHHRDHFKHNRGRYHRGDLIGAVFGGHQADNITADNIHATHRMQQLHRLID